MILVETEVSYPNQIRIFTLFSLFLLQVRAQLVQQQQAAAAVQAAQAQAAQMGASGQVRAQEPVSLLQACSKCTLEMSMEMGFWCLSDEGSDVGRPLCKGDMGFCAVSPLRGVRGRISLITSLCMLSVPSR